MVSWQRRSWSISGAIIAGLTLTLTLPLALQLSLVLQRPLCAARAEQRALLYTALTAFAMAANALPMVTLVYLNLGGGSCPAMRQKVSPYAAKVSRN